MPLSPVSTLFDPVTCMPAWVVKYTALPNTTVPSGCPIGSNGNANCDPAAMARAAGVKLGTDVSLEAYTLARYATAEVGSGPVTERVAVMQNALNRVRYIEKSGNILQLLLYRQSPGHPNRGFYGPIHSECVEYDSAGKCAKRLSPYGRWAATSKDPTNVNIMLAKAVLSGEIPEDFAKFADDQMGPDGLKDPVGSVRSHGINRRQFWVGPLAGVNPFHTIQYRTLKDVDPKSELGQRLIDRGVAAMQAPRPNWTGLPICPEGAATSAISVRPKGPFATLIGGVMIAVGAVLVSVAIRRQRSRQ